MTHFIKKRGRRNSFPLQVFTEGLIPDYGVIAPVGIHRISVAAAATAGLY